MARAFGPEVQFPCFQTIILFRNVTHLSCQGNNDVKLLGLSHASSTSHKHLVLP
jgi:hypothetical protein